MKFLKPFQNADVSSMLDWLLYMEDSYDLKLTSQR